MPGPDADAAPGRGPFDGPPGAPVSAPADGRRALIERPWVWALLVGLMFGVPLIKSLGKDLPPLPPGSDGPSMDFVLPDEHGEPTSLAELAGALRIVTELPLANAVETERAFDGIRALRKRLRGMGMTVFFVVLCHGGNAETLSALLDAKTARKPVNFFLLDAGHEEMDILRQRAGSLGARFFLLDRHGRVRGAYGDSQQDIDDLVHLTGLLGNWPGADPAPDDA